MQKVLEIKIKCLPLYRVKEITQRTGAVPGTKEKEKMKALFFIISSNGIGVTGMYSKKEELIKECGNPKDGEQIVELKEGDADFNFCWPYRER